MPNILYVDVPFPLKYSEIGSTNQETIPSEQQVLVYDSEDGKRVCDLALTFLKLNSTSGAIIKLGSYTVKILDDFKEFIHSFRQCSLQDIIANLDVKPVLPSKKGPQISKKQLRHLAKLSFSIGCLVFAILYSKFAKMAEKTVSVGVHGYKAYQYAFIEQNTKKTLESLAKCMGSGLYLGVQIIGGPELTVVSLVVRVGFIFYEAFDDFAQHQGQLRIEVIVSIALGCVSLQKITPHISDLRVKYSDSPPPIQSLIQFNVATADPKQDEEPSPDKPQAVVLTDSHAQILRRPMGKHRFTPLSTALLRDPAYRHPVWKKRREFFSKATLLRL